MRQIFVALLVVMLSPALFSQEEMNNRIGAGISIDPARLGQANYFFYSPEGFQEVFLINNSPIAFYLPIHTSPKFRIEPSFAFYSLSVEHAPTYTSYSVTSDSKDISAISAGLRAVYVARLSNALNSYFGPRLEVTFLSSTFEDFYIINNSPRVTRISETKETDVTVGLVFGAEYFPISQFSVGGEFSFNYISFGNPDLTRTTTPPQPSPMATPGERKQHSFRTDVLFFVRWYFLQSAWLSEFHGISGQRACQTA